MAKIAWTGSSAIITASVGGELPTGVYYWWQAADTTPWNQQTVKTGNYSRSAIVWTGTEVGISAYGADNKLYCWSQKAGTTPWEEETVADFSEIDIDVIPYIDMSMA